LKKKVTSAIVLSLFLISALTLTLNIQSVKADYVWTENIHIKADGSVYPDTAPISSIDNVTYTLTDNVVEAAPSWFDIAILIERDNIVFEGAGHTLQGTHADYSKGISLEERSNVTIKNTNIKGFKHGVYFKSTSYSTLSGNNITECNGNGIALSDSSYNIISGNTITGNDGSGIGLYGLVGTTNNNVISANNITANNSYGIYLDYSSSNNISKNNVTDNKCGIGLIEFSNNNVISRNNITDNESGITLGYSSTNSIFGNNIKKNSEGIHIGNNSSDNIVYHNNFINNTNQVVSKNLVNVWDGGYPSGGNFWSDYTGVDANGDGIGDDEYVIDANNTDRYPLTGPITVFYAGTWNKTAYNVDVVSNSTVSDFHFNPDEGPFLRFNVSGDDGTAGFCRVTIPKDLLWVEDGQWSVLVSGQSVNYTIIPDENHTYIYFTYNHTTKTVEIQGTHVIPEFPSTPILMLLMLTTLIATILLKKKRKRQPP
jgi:parallel beta-helix repeat protein